MPCIGRVIAEKPSTIILFHCWQCFLIPYFREWCAFNFVNLGSFFFFSGLGLLQTLGFSIETREWNRAFLYFRSSTRCPTGKRLVANTSQDQIYWRSVCVCSCVCIVRTRSCTIFLAAVFGRWNKNYIFATRSPLLPPQPIQTLPNAPDVGFN